jgi:hypothetical protein
MCIVSTLGFQLKLGALAGTVADRRHRYAGAMKHRPRAQVATGISHRASDALLTDDDGTNIRSRRVLGQWGERADKTHVDPFALHDFRYDVTYPHGRLLSMVSASLCLALFSMFVDDELQSPYLATSVGHHRRDERFNGCRRSGEALYLDHF